ncbi:hypothetical protein QBC42DRAFT_277762 [Cladorrhinum samala]|uniref:Uncharacterized protein n=1 Tax=Cladorrhinum samala TaxID=585594 RepID=A0AAV9HDE4_9PEZI|nr:hypothetical protein QBC42DRAFT_277762 [Cladorrhinum samala]
MRTGLEFRGPLGLVVDRSLDEAFERFSCKRSGKRFFYGFRAVIPLLIVAVTVASGLLGLPSLLRVTIWPWCSPILLYFCQGVLGEVMQTKVSL